MFQPDVDVESLPVLLLYVYVQHNFAVKLLSVCTLWRSW